MNIINVHTCTCCLTLLISLDREHITRLLKLTTPEIIRPVHTIVRNPWLVPCANLLLI